MTGDDTDKEIGYFFKGFNKLYHSQPFPEEKTYHDGTVFNELELYWSKRNEQAVEDIKKSDIETDEDLQSALESLSLGSNIQ